MSTSNTQTPKSIDIKSLDTIMKDNDKAPSPIIDDGILLDKTLLLVFGQPKAKKTFLCLNMGLAIAQGKSFAGFKIPGAQKVLFLSAEGGYYPIRDRIKTMVTDIKEEHRNNFKMCFNARLNLMVEEDLDLIVEHIDAYKPKVLIIDPFVRFHDNDENSASEMSKVLGNIRHLIEQYNLSIILVHHAGKDNTRGLRGSSAIVGEYDSSIHIANSGETSSLSFDMRHVKTPEDRKIIFDDKTLWFDVFLNETPVVNVIKAIGSSATKKEIVDILMNEHSYSDSGAYKAIDRAVAKNLITTKDGTYSLQ
ncbi:MAG: AAA family ATPase [Ignavibacteriales bacterium]|nr:AAA family ATPase [Ignavibacteriales bacterium]